MKFDVKRIYTAVNAEEVKVGSKVICGDNLFLLKKRIEEGDVHIHELTSILAENLATRFKIKDFGDYALCYLVSEPEEKKLKWTDLKMGDILQIKKTPSIKYMITGIDAEGSESHIFIAGSWLLDKELELWEKVEGGGDHLIFCKKN